MRLSFLILIALGPALGCRGETTTKSSASACDEYLDCLDELTDKLGDKTSYEQAKMIFGSASGCNQSASAKQQCEQGCKSAMQSLKDNHMSCEGLDDPNGGGGAGGAGGSGAGGGGGNGGDVELTANYSCDLPGGMYHICYDNHFPRISAQTLKKAQDGCARAGGQLVNTCSQVQAIGFCYQAKMYDGYLEDVTQWFYSGNVNTLAMQCRGSWTTK
jgi:hypothetical protein